MKQDTAITLTEIPPGKCCKLCGAKRPFEEYVFNDNGRLGVSPRCEACRNRGRRREPGLPELRYHLKRHAAERYIERVRPELAELERSAAIATARREMRYAMATAAWRPRVPSWCGDTARHGAREPPGCLLIDNDVVFVLARPRGRGVSECAVVTVLTRLQHERD